MQIDPDTMNNQSYEESKQKAKESRYQKREELNILPEEDEIVFQPDAAQQPQYEKEVQYETQEEQPELAQQEEEVLPGLYLSEIHAWKKQYGDVYHVNVKGRDFIFRTLQRFEYKEIISVPNSTPLMREEMICEYCTLYPFNYDFTSMTEDAAGYPAILSEAIMDHSGFTRDIEVRKL